MAKTRTSSTHHRAALHANRGAPNVPHSALHRTSIKAKKAALPTDITTLQAMLVERDLMVEKLKLQIARMKRVRFGASSEQLDSQILQLELIVEDLESTQGALGLTGISGDTNANANADVDADPPAQANVEGTVDLAAAASADVTALTRTRALPAHLPRERVRYEPLVGNTCGCKHCGATHSHLTHLGDDESEVLEYVPGRFKVVTHVRPKYACGQCHTISQALAPSRPLARSYAGACHRKQICRSPAALPAK
jgi:hypothetical protein